MSRSISDGIIPGNHLLSQLPDADRDALLVAAHEARLPTGHSVLCVGDSMPSVYFPTTGAIALISEMTTGHHVAVDVVGNEGVVGVGEVFGAVQCAYRMVVLAESEGHWVAADQLRHAFEHSDAFRRTMLLHVCDRLSKVMVTAACNRVHSHRQRLARWLLIATDKSGQQSLHVTHDTLAQLVGGPRHAVTVAVQELREKGAVAHLRARLEIVDRASLLSDACECYRRP